jgi:VirE N-terminal domain
MSTPTTISRATASNAITTDAALVDVLDDIKSGRGIAPVIAEIRRVYAATIPQGAREAKDAISPLKRGLPAAMFSGKFTARRADALVQHSGLIVADLDELGDDLERVAGIARADIHAVSGFRSPSGDGFKIVYRCDPSDHAAAFRAMRHHVQALYGIEPDASGKDVSRLCFLSHDPAAWTNLDAVELPAAPVEVAPVVRIATPSAPAQSRVDDVIVLPAREGLSISESAAAIFGRIGPTNTLFSRGGIVHEIAEKDGVDELSIVDANAFRSRLDRYGRVMAHRVGKNDNTVLAPAICSVDTARALLSSREANEVLPSVSAVLAAPVIASDGKDVLVCGKGYHAVNGGIFVTGGDDPPDVPIAEAIARLRYLLADFDFPSKGDEARALASLVSPALRFGGILPALAPVDVAEADQSQAGKTYRHKLIAAIYREKLNFVIQKTGGVGSLDETIGERLVAGKPFVIFDNLRGRVTSTFFESALTAGGRVGCRIPHKGNVDVDVRPFVFGATSNGMEATIDLANRSVITRIRKRPAGYSFKAWPEGDLLAHVERNQAYYLGCVFAVVIEWLRRGKPTTTETRHDFRAWVQSMDYIVQSVMQAAPVMDGHEAHKQRVANPALSWLRQIALDLVSRAKSGWHSASELAEASSDTDTPIPGSRPDAHDDDRARAVGRIMGKLFRESPTVEVDGITVERKEDYNPEGRTNSKAYRFTCGNAAMRQCL